MKCKKCGEVEATKTSYFFTLFCFPCYKEVYLEAKRSETDLDAFVHRLYDSKSLEHTAKLMNSREKEVMRELGIYNEEKPPKDDWNLLAYNFGDITL